MMRRPEITVHLNCNVGYAGKAIEPLFVDCWQLRFFGNYGRNYSRVPGAYAPEVKVGNAFVANFKPLPDLFG